MSHIVTIKTQIRDPIALHAACRRLKLEAPVHGTATLYNGATATGLRVKLPGWRYPVVVEEGGQLKYDNYGGHWGKQAELDRLVQAYAVEKARLEARKAGKIVTEQALPDGSIRLTVGGAA